MSRYICALTALSMMVVPADIVAQDTVWNRYTLEDLGGVFVRTEAATCESVGITRQVVQAEAEAILVESEVDLLTEGEMLRNPALPELRVTLECAASEGASGAVAYSVSVRVQQAAQMTRDSQISLPEAVTWWSSEVGVGDETTAQEALQDALKGKIEEFATAYIEANTEPADTTGTR
jgi:hypothetical protein